MRNKSVAVLDIRSSEICAAIAEKGVNNTFIIKSRYNCHYEGFAEGELIDVNDFTAAVRRAVNGIISSVGGSVKEIFIGVPDEFTEVIQTDKVMSFSSSQRLTDRHVRALTDISVPEISEGETIVKCAPMYYVLSDNRKVIDPVGSVSDSLRAKLTFYVGRTAFLDCVLRALSQYQSIKYYRWIPQSYAQSMYLVEPEKRDGQVILFDLGYISSSFSVVCGNGVAFSEAFSVGIGHVAVLLMEALDLPYEVACAFLKKVNLNAKERLTSYEEFNYDGKLYSFLTTQLRDVIREGLDALCEMVETCRQNFVGKDLSGKPILMTGEGVGVIRGTTEHLSSRLVTPMEVVTPRVPYYDKPQFSSLFSLLAAALG